MITATLLLVPFAWLERLSIWQWLNVPSPSIGLTRAYWLIIHGRPVEAWHFNRLIFLVITIGAPLLIHDCLQILKRRQSSG